MTELYKNNQCQITHRSEDDTGWTVIFSCGAHYYGTSTFDRHNVIARHYCVPKKEAV